jgi:membrane-associated HD superfamily phosphohydrolase
MTQAVPTPNDMKTFILIAVIGLLAPSLRAQWTVYDPAVHTQTILNGVQEIAKFVEVINNQVQQIQSLKDQLTEFKDYKEKFGDPAKVALGTVNALTTDLKMTEVGQTLTALSGAVNAGEAMIYDGGGLFRKVGEEFTTPGGQKVLRAEAPYLAVAAVQKTTENFLSVSTDTASRRVALKQQIAATSDQINSAKSDAEVQKLTAVLVGLSAALQSTEQEVGQATASAVVQDIANRADQQRQLQAKKEQEHAEFTEAVENSGKKFRLLTAPAKFPIK